MSRDRQKIRFAVDLAESIIIESSGRSDGRVVQTQTCVARYFRISLLADVYYLFAASNPFDISRWRINRSADHRGAAGQFLAKTLILIIPFAVPADIVRRYYPNERAAIIRQRLCSRVSTHRGPALQRRLCSLFKSRHRFREQL